MMVPPLSSHALVYVPVAAISHPAHGLPTIIVGAYKIDYFIIPVE